LESMKSNLMKTIKLSIQAISTGFEPAICKKNSQLKGLKAHIRCLAAIST
jgi:hypothetical protein